MDGLRKITAKGEHIKMKKIWKTLTLFCLILFLGVTAKPVTVQASTYITSAAKSNYSYASQSDSFSFYADCNWKAEFQGYPGMGTITSSTSGSSGTYTLYFRLAENKMSGDIGGAILIRNANTGVVLCYNDLRQAGKNMLQPSNPVKNPSTNQSGQSNNGQTTTTNTSNTRITKGASVEYSCDAQKGSFDFYSDCNWKADFQGYPGMVSLSYGASGGSGDRTLYFDIAANKQSYSREGVILIKDASTGTVLCQAIVKQKAYQAKVVPVTPSLTINKNSFNFDYQNQSGSFSVTSNVKWTIRTSYSWVHLDKTSGSGNAQIRFTCDENKGDSERTANVTVWSDTIVRTIWISQEPHRVNAPAIEIGVTDWGVFKQKNMKTLKAPAINNVVRIDYNEECGLDTMLLVRLTHQTLLHKSESTQYCYVQNPASGSNGICSHRSALCPDVKDHRFKVFFRHNEKFETIKKKWKITPEFKIETTFYNEETGREEPLTYIIRFTNVLLQAGPAKWFGFPENVVYPCGPDGIHPPANDSNYYKDTTIECPICKAKFTGSTDSANWDLKNHVIRWHSSSLSDLIH